MTAADERALRDELERVQQENKELRGCLAEENAFSTKELLARIEELEATNAELRARLERADEVREDWSRRATLLRLELDTARTEQTRLRRLLETVKDERRLGRAPSAWEKLLGRG
jgi:chromosome segregation ATPase